MPVHLETAQYFGWPFLGICVAGCLILSRRTAWPMVVLAAYAAYLVSVGGDILSLRFSTFLYPYLLIGLATLLAWIPPLPGKVRPFYGILLPVAVCLALGIQGIFRMDDARTERFSQLGHLYVPNNSIGAFQADYPAARFLAMGAMKNDLLATDNIGAVGYYSGLRILDSAGIANKPVVMLLAARRFGEVGEHIRASSPDWILCYPYLTHKGEGWWMLGAGDITRWVRGSYHPVRYWQSITGYTRVLLKKNR